MPLYWTIDSKVRLFIGSGEGEVTFADAMALLDALAGARAQSYQKLFDGRAVQSFHDWRRAACAVCQNPGPSRARACRCPCDTDCRVCPPAGRTSFRRPAHQDVSRSETGAYLVGQPEKIKPGGRCHALILQRLKERALELPHLAIAVTTNGRSHRKLAHSGSVGARAGPPFLRQGP
jgi:hypothetical protein